jgi:hypothetical protein
MYTYTHIYREWFSHPQNDLLPLPRSYEGDKSYRHEKDILTVESSALPQSHTPLLIASCPLVHEHYTVW